MQVTGNHLNGIGILMGGALFTLADYTFSQAANSYGKIAVTRTASIVYMRKCRNGVVSAIATEISRNELTGDYVVEISNDQDQVIARVEGTILYWGKYLKYNTLFIQRTTRSKYIKPLKI